MNNSSKLLYLLLVGILLLSCKETKVKTCDYIIDYYPKVYQAELAFEKRDYASAYKGYKEAFRFCDAKNTITHNERLNFIKSCCHLEEYEEAAEYMRKEMEEGYELIWLLDNELFSPVFDRPEGKKLVADYEQIHQEYLNRIDLDLRKEIQAMQTLDQKFRIRGQYDFYRDSIDYADSINTERLVELFETIGYPNEEDFGRFTIDRIHTDISGMLLHTEDSIRMNYFVPKLKELILKGDCQPDVLAGMVDGYHTLKGKSQIYGTWTSMKNGEKEYATMIDRAEVDKNRLSIGLPPLALQEELDSLKKARYFGGN